MAFSSKHLTQGEHVDSEFRTHAKKIFGPILLILAMIAVVIVAYIYLQDTGWPWLFLAIVIIALLITITWALIPIWKWRNTVFVLTNRRLITRTGIMAKSGRDIPLFRINDVQYEKDFSDRILGCGTLIVSDASDQPPLRLHDVPRVEAMQVKLNELLFAHHDDADEGNAPRRSQPPAAEPFDQHSYDNGDTGRAAQQPAQPQQQRPVEPPPMRDSQQSRQQRPGSAPSDSPYDQAYERGFDRGYEQGQHGQQGEQGQYGQQEGGPAASDPQTGPQTRPLPRQDGDGRF